MDNIPEQETFTGEKGENSNLEATIANALGLTSEEVELKNAHAFINKESRFLYGITEPTVTSSLDKAPLRPGFFKFAKDSETTLQLKRESEGTTIARAVGIPTVDILHPYMAMPDEQGLIHLERLRAEDGVFLANPELIATADPELGARAAVALRNASGRVIPENLDTTILRRNDDKNQSFETFSRAWEDQSSKVLAESNTELVDRLIGTDTLQGIFNQTLSSIEPLIKAAQNPNVEYFIHNDASPNNTFFSNTGKVVFLDFEYAAASHNHFLARITDLGNYYGRMWSNPEMQQRFLATYLSESSQKTLEYNYQLLRGAAVFGVACLAKYGMSIDHPEHDMAVSLLGHLQENLIFLERQYNEIKGSPKTQDDQSTSLEQVSTKTMQNDELPQEIPRDKLLQKLERTQGEDARDILKDLSNE